MSPTLQSAVSSHHPAGHGSTARNLIILPTEILHDIVDQVDPKALGSLRLSCKTLRSVSTKPFGIKRLSNRGYFFTPKSMRALERITRHPIFGPCVQSLRFGTRRLDTDFNCVMRALSIKNITEASESMQILKEYHAACEDQCSLTAATALAQMSRAFTNLASHGKHKGQVTVGIFDGPSPCPDEDGQLSDGCGTASMYSNLRLDIWCHKTGQTLSALCSAVRGHNFKPKSFELELKNLPCIYIDRVLADSFGSLLLSHIGVLETKVRLHLKDQFHSLSLCPTESLFHLQGQLPGDQTYQLSDLLDFPGVLIWQREPMSQALRSLRLQKMHIHHCMLSSVTISTLFDMYASNLRQLDLNHIAFLLVGDWAFDPIGFALKLVRKLQSLPELERVSLRNMGYNNSLYLSGGTFISSEVWEGKEEIKRGIANLTYRLEKQRRVFDPRTILNL